MQQSRACSSTSLPRNCLGVTPESLLEDGADNVVPSGCTVATDGACVKVADATVATSLLRAATGRWRLLLCGALHTKVNKVQAEQAGAGLAQQQRSRAVGCTKAE